VLVAECRVDILFDSRNLVETQQCCKRQNECRV
jgi:hypothetical protein